jgi:hypothetical protein
VDRAVAGLDQRIDPEHEEPRGDRHFKRPAQGVERLFQPTRLCSAVVEGGPAQQQADRDEDHAARGETDAAEPFRHRQPGSLVEMLEEAAGRGLVKLDQARAG